MKTNHENNSVNPEALFNEACRLETTANGGGIPWNEVFQLLKKAAAHGHVAAARKVAAMYQAGIGVSVDEIEAFNWTLRAAHAGDGECQRSLGQFYLAGNGIGKSEVDAASWFMRAADNGDLIAKLELGRCYLHGRGVAKDPQKALELYQAAAKAGLTDAKLTLAEWYRNGEGGMEDVERALAWYRDAAQSGSERAKMVLVEALDSWREFDLQSKFDNLPREKQLRQSAKEGLLDAMRDLGAYYRKGFLFLDREVIPKRPVESFRWYLRAAIEGDAKAQLELGRLFHEGVDVIQDDEEALDWCYKSAKQGLADAQFLAAQILSQDSFPLSRRIGAVTFAMLAAEQNHVPAQYLYAKFLQKGELIAKNSQKLVHYLRLAAAAGHQQSQCELGIMLIESGTESFGEGVEWLVKASDQGHPVASREMAKLILAGKLSEDEYDYAQLYIEEAAAADDAEAQYLYARMFEEGHTDSDLNLVEAHAWYTKSIANGWEDAEDALLELEARMSDSELKMARAGQVE